MNKNGNLNENENVIENENESKMFEKYLIASKIF